MRALKTAALGMSAQQMNVDIIANNLANVNTNGFKKSTLEFQDLLYETMHVGNRDGEKGKGNPTGLQVGLGNRAIATTRAFSEGNVSETGNPLDIAINGKGFFHVEMPDGSYAYTRDGSLKMNAEGKIVTNAGQAVLPEIIIPENARSISVSEDGVVSVMLNGESEAQELGQIELVSFMNPAGLEAIGGNLFVQTQASGDPVYGAPAMDGMGALMQGYLEKSNVDVAEEMINLIVAQRAYEMNSKAVKTADELMSMANQLKR